MLALLLMLGGAAPLGPDGVGPDGVGADDKVELALGPGATARVAVTFAGKSGYPHAGIYVWSDAAGWCHVAAGDYVRGSAIIDRGGKRRGIRLIDRQERLTELRREGGLLVLHRGGRDVRRIDPSRSGCGIVS